MIRRTFFERFGHQGVAVLPDTVLSDDPLVDPDTDSGMPSLREQVSLVNGVYHHLLCYARVLSSCGDGLYWAIVAATPDFVNTIRVILTEEDLYAALPLDVRLQGKCPGDILVAMQAHAKAVRPARRTALKASFENSSAQAEPVPPQQPREETTLIPLPELFVSCTTINEAIAETLEPSQDRIPSHPTRWTRLVWLRAALAMVRRQMYHSRQQFAKLDVLLDKVLSAQRHMRQALVSACPVYLHQRLIGWRLQIGLPFAEVLA